MPFLDYCLMPALSLRIAEPADAEADVTTTEAPATEEGPAITVTGSRISGLPKDGTVQTLSVTREDIQQSGAGTIIEVLQDLPVTSGGGQTFSTATAGALSSDTPVGASAVSLRGLGASSTLTLINGRRAQISAFARGQESFIDASSIPLAAIERVEVLKGPYALIFGRGGGGGIVNRVQKTPNTDGFKASASAAGSSSLRKVFSSRPVRSIATARTGLPSR